MNDITRRRRCARILFVVFFPFLLIGFIADASREWRRIRRKSR